MPFLPFSNADIGSVERLYWRSNIIQRPCLSVAMRGLSCWYMETCSWGAIQNSSLLRTPARALLAIRFPLLSLHPPQLLKRVYDHTIVWKGSCRRRALRHAGASHHHHEIRYFANFPAPHFRPSSPLLQRSSNRPACNLEDLPPGHQVNGLTYFSNFQPAFSICPQTNWARSTPQHSRQLKVVLAINGKLYLGLNLAVTGSTSSRSHLLDWLDQCVSSKESQMQAMCGRLCSDPTQIESLMFCHCYSLMFYYLPRQYPRSPLRTRAKDMLMPSSGLSLIQWGLFPDFARLPHHLPPSWDLRPYVSHQ